MTTTPVWRWPNVHRPRSTTRSPPWTTSTLAAASVRPPPIAPRFRRWPRGHWRSARRCVGYASVRGARDVIARIAEQAGLDEETTAHTLRHTFATVLVPGGTDLVLVAELLGHARFETTRGCTRPSGPRQGSDLLQSTVDLRTVSRRFGVPPAERPCGKTLEDGAELLAFGSQSVRAPDRWPSVDSSIHQPGLLEFT